MKTVKRKANVGERILITNASLTDNEYQNGDILTVTVTIGEDENSDAHVYGKGVDICILDEEYEVIIENKTELEAVGMANEMGIIEQMQADLARTKDELAELKTKVAALEGKRFTKETDVRKATAYDFFHGKHFDKVKSPQEIRDDIVAQAKRDVADLKRPGKGFGKAWEYRANLGGFSEFGEGSGDAYNCEYVIDKEKRTVVALLRGFNGGTVLKRGIAKCDPSDCFNASIGRAISLRRALGLEVPAEYYKAPQPTEVRVGDVVKWESTTYEILEINGDKYSFRGVNDGWESGPLGYSSDTVASRIIDDSRE